MKTTIRKTLLTSLLALGAMASAQAGTLEFQGVTFTSSWTDNVKFTFNGGVTDFSSPHLKVNFFDGDGGRKVGSLLSENIPLAPVPEPSAYAMMLGGLALLGGVVGRRRAVK